MSRNNSLLSLDGNGELIYHGLNRHINQKYKPDSPLEKSFIPYAIMILCAIVDGSVFMSLFTLISFDSPLLMAAQVAGCLFGYDIVPLYLGIQIRRIKQGLSKDRFLVWLAIAVFIIVFAMNVILRIMTIDLLSPDLSTAINYFGTTVQEADTGFASDAIALTIFSIFLPLITSMGSFIVSYLTYNPLQIRQKRLEVMITEKLDEIRRLDAILTEYDMDTDFAENLLANDQDYFIEMKKMQMAVVVSYCELVRQRLKEYLVKEHLADPSAINALSEETCVAILNRLYQELVALDQTAVPAVYAGTGKGISLEGTAA